VYRKSRKHHERYWFLLFSWTFTQTNLKQIAEMKTPDLSRGKTVFLTFIIASMLSEIIHNILSVYLKSRKHHERYCFLSFWWTSTQTNLKQMAEMKTTDPNCEKTVFLTFIKASMLPVIIHRIFFNLWKSKETLWKSLF